jgi:hypothetical protein
MSRSTSATVHDSRRTCRHRAGARPRHTTSPERPRTATRWPSRWPSARTRSSRFLSTGCLTCRTFWDGLQPDVRTPLPGDARVVVVVKDPAFESPSKLRELAPPDVPVVQSSRAWEDFGIAMSPYFCYVDGATGDVRSEGAAMTWEQVASLLPRCAARRGAGHADMSPGVGSATVLIARRRRRRARRDRGPPVDVVAVRNVDAGKHHPARGAGARVSLVGDGDGVRPGFDGRRGRGRQWPGVPGGPRSRIARP